MSAQLRARATPIDLAGHAAQRITLEHAQLLVADVVRGKAAYSLALPLGPLPGWAWKLLAPLYIHAELDGRAPSAGDVVPLAEPVAGFEGLVLADDPELDGAIRLVALYADELALIETWDANRFVAAWLDEGSRLVTDPGRPSSLSGDFGSTSMALARSEGSSIGQLHFDGGWSETTDEGLELHLPGGEEAMRIRSVLRARLGFDRPLFLVGPEGAGTVAFVHDASGFRAELQDDTLVFFGGLDDPEVQQLIGLLDPDGPGVTVRLG